MAWPKGTPRPPTAGRRKGTPNRSSLPVAELCEFHKCSPLEGLIKFCSHPNDDYKMKAMLALMEYLYPKRKALEIDASIDMEIAKRAKDIEELPRSEQIKLLREELKRLEGESDGV